MSVHQKVGFLLLKVSSAACGLALPGQGVFGAVLASLLLQLWGDFLFVYHARLI